MSRRVSEEYARSIFGAPEEQKTVRKRRVRLTFQTRMFLFMFVILAGLTAGTIMYLRPETATYTLDNYQVATVSTHDFRSLLVTAGRVVPEQVGRTTAPNVTATGMRLEVGEIYVEPGDDVILGQILVELKADGLHDELRKVEGDREAAAIELAQALLQLEYDAMLADRDLENASKALQAAEAHLELLERLFERGGVSKKDVDDAVDVVESRRSQIASVEQTQAITRQRGELSIKKAENQLQTIDKQLTALQHHISGLTIRADRAGRVLSMDAAKASAVSPGSELVAIADLSLQYVEIAISPQQALDVKPGMQALIKLGGYSMPAMVSRVAPAATTTSEGAAVIARLTLDPEVAQTLLPNTEVTAEIELGLRVGRSALPRGLFFSSGDASFVYVLDADGMSAHRRDVRFGAIDGSVIEVLDGLGPGDKIIYSSYSAFRSYPTIELLPEGGRYVEWP